MIKIGINDDNGHEFRIGDRVVLVGGFRKPFTGSIGMRKGRIIVKGDNGSWASCQYLRDHGSVAVPITDTDPIALAMSTEDGAEKLRRCAELIRGGGDPARVFDELKDVVRGSDGVAGWHLNGEVADWEEFELLGDLALEDREPCT